MAAHMKGNQAHMAWSPDGERILFTDSRMGFKDEVLNEDNPQPYGAIFLMRCDGTDVEQLTDNQWEEGTPAWQPNAGCAQRQRCGWSPENARAGDEVIRI